MDDEARKHWQGLEDVAELLDAIEHFTARYNPGPRFEFTWKVDTPADGCVAAFTFTIDENGTVITDDLSGEQVTAQTLREMNARKRQN